MEKSRIKNTKRNIIFSYISIAVQIVFQFVSRTLIVQYFGDEYLGVASLFGSILTVLNMAELGFSSAIVFNMYKPLAEGKTEKVCALLAYYKKVYHIVGTIILIAGLAVIPFLPKLIKEGVPVGMDLYALYLMYLSNTVISYFLFAYETSLLDALQRTDLVKTAYILVGIGQYIFQIISILLWKNYYVFLALMLIGTGARNIYAAWIAKKKYPQYQCKYTIDSETKKDIGKRIKGLLVGSISGVTYTTLDSIILSSFIGLSAVAIYNNYLLILTNIANLVAMIRSAMQASVGNSVASESKEKNYQDMLLWQFFFAVIATWCVTCMFSIYQPFMTFWMGAERLLPLIDVGLLCLWFFESVLSHSFFLYLSGNGLWWEMRWPYILSTICNLALNIVLGKLYGTTGIIFSTWFSSLIFGLVWQCKIIFKEYFQIGISQFIMRFIAYFGVCAVSTTIAFYINRMLPDWGIWGLVVRLFVCTFVSILTMWLIFRKTQIYCQAIDFTKKVIFKRI